MTGPWTDPTCDCHYCRDARRRARADRIQWWALRFVQAGIIAVLGWATISVAILLLAGPVR